jgi:hypothetical protein
MMFHDTKRSRVARDGRREVMRARTVRRRSVASFPFGFFFFSSTARGDETRFGDAGAA